QVRERRRERRGGVLDHAGGRRPRDGERGGGRGGVVGSAAAAPGDRDGRQRAGEEPRGQADSNSSTVCGPTHAIDSLSCTDSATRPTSSNVVSSSRSIV